MTRETPEWGPCNHGPGCCVECCPAEPDSTGTGEGCPVCQPDDEHGETQRDRDRLAGFAVLFRGRPVKAPTRVGLASLEPSEADFRQRDAAKLCIDCGVRPQPPRDDGTGTHHRCNSCRRVYDRRTDLRSLLCDTDQLTYTQAGVSGAKCSHCEQSIGVEFHFSYPVPESAYMGYLACHDCARDARFEIAPPASVARVDLRPVDSGERGLNLAVMVPVGVPALFAFGASLVSWAWRTTKGRVQGGTMYRAEDKHVTVYIDGIDRDADGSRFVASIALNIASVAKAITVTKGWGQSVRDALYDMGPRGRRAARRVQTMPTTDR